MLVQHMMVLSVRRGRVQFQTRQDGVVLMVALIILVALTIGGIALVRSVDTTNIISGNLAFQQAATRAGEKGTELAIRTFLEATTGTTLQTNNYANGYAASTPAGRWLAAGDTAGNPESWDAYWATVIDPSPKALPVTALSCGHGGGRSCTMQTDAAGNTVSYTIQRLCATAGKPDESGCAASSRAYAECHKVGCIPPALPTQYYYRITSRIAGPRNTVSYIQTIVAIAK